MRKAGRAVTGRPAKGQGTRRRTKTGQGDTGGFTAGEIVARFLKLCRDPAQDLMQWMAEDRKRPGGLGKRVQSTTRRENTHADDRTGQHATGGHGLRRDALPSMRDGVDADRQGRRGADSVLARQRAGAGRYDELLTVRAEAARGGVGSSAGVGESEAGGVKGFYAAKIAMLRRSLPKREVAAAVIAARAEMRAALRAIAERRAWETAARRMERLGLFRGDKQEGAEPKIG
jgi:hypothetical protein